MAIWDDLISENDRQMYQKYRMYDRLGFGEHPAVLVVDFTYAFVDDRFSTGYSATGKPAVAATAKVLAAARKKGVPVIYTKGYIKKTAAEMGMWKSSGIRSEADTSDIANPHDVVAEIAPASCDPEISKSKPSAFFGTCLIGILNHYHVDTLLVCGMSTSGCIRATVVDGFSYGYRMILPLECIADRSDIGHKINLFDIHMKYGDVVELQEVLDYLQNLK